MMYPVNNIANSSSIFYYLIQSNKKWIVSKISKQKERDKSNSSQRSIHKPKGPKKSLTMADKIKITLNSEQIQQIKPAKTKFNGK